MDLIKEIALADVVTAKKAIRAGVDRIELNARLDLGGVTPTFAAVQGILDMIRGTQVELVVMVRPRGGDFVYSGSEIEQMKQSIERLKQMGVKNVTFGVLTPAQGINYEKMNELIEFTQPMAVVFHMAFDEIPVTDKLAEIDWLAQHRVQRILTHGGSLDLPIEETLDALKETVELAQDRIEILPGGGITFANAEKVAEYLQITQVHGSKIIDIA